MNRQMYFLGSSPYGNMGGGLYNTQYGLPQSMANYLNQPLPGQSSSGNAIYPRLDQLNSGVSSAEQELQQINQSIDQVQSTLGESSGQPAGTGVMDARDRTVFGIPNGPGLKDIYGEPATPGAYPNVPALTDIYAEAQKSAQDKRAGGFMGRIVLPGEMSFGDFSNIYNAGGFQAGPLGSSPMSSAMRSMAAGGGMMGRQNYGLGSLVKSVTKGVKSAVSGAVDAVKGVAKSDLGKAALLAGGAYFAPTLFGQSAGFGNFGNLIKGGVGSLFSKIPGASTISGFLGGERTLGKTLGVFAGGSLLGGLLAGMPAAEQEEFLQGGRTPEQVEALRIKLTDAYRSQRTFAGRPDEDAAIAAQVERDLSEYVQASNRAAAAYGGRMKYARGNSPEDNAMQASNAMGLPLNQNPAGVTELDLRETGGFIPPVGVKEKADDIPAMLSNNEFVFTADAVRGMGGGDVNKGAQRMYDMMKKLEKGGRV